MEINKNDLWRLLQLLLSGKLIFMLPMCLAMRGIM